MPAILAIPAFWSAAAAAAGGAATVYGVNKASESSDKALQASTQANRDAIAEQRRQDDIAQFNFQQQQKQAKDQWDAQQAIKAPYRQAGQVALGHLGDLLGVNFNPALMPQTQPFKAAPAAGMPTPTAAPPTNQPAVQQLRSLMPAATNNQMSPGSVQVKDANGMVHTFASQAQADAFRRGL